jgi:eukaryotic-like serine/threonine-protein kinase
MKTTQLDIPRRRPGRARDIWRVLGRLFHDTEPSEMPVRPSKPAPGHIQRFQVISELGSGGMGTVYRALDPQLEREVAIKVLAHPCAAARSLSVHDTLDLKHSTRRSGIDLLAEARMMARLSHPNVLPVYEVGLAEDALFVVMEYIDGCDLATWLSVPRTLDEVLHVLAEAGRGLAAAHARGIVHRDFKPENVLVGVDGRVCVADFGLSQLIDADTASLVQLQVTAGTPGYMAPELLRGEPATIASDVFAFATAVAEALGCPPRTCLDDRDRKLRERGASARLRSAVTSGLAREPVMRCSLDHLIASVERKRWRLLRWLTALTTR